MTLPRIFPYSAIENENPLRCTDCSKCPRCRTATRSDRTQVYIAQMGLSYHRDCYLNNEGLS